MKSGSRVFSYPDKKGVLRYRPAHHKIFILYVWLEVIALVPILWGLFLTLMLSVGWVNPFQASVDWYGVHAPGWLFDLVYARANGHPDGAHILSWMSPIAFGLAIWFKTIPRPIKTFHEALGDPFQGIAALIFIGGIHEILWVGFYYTAYWQYLDWSLFFEVLRDVSFGVMMILFILAFWKLPNRIIPLSLFKKIIIVYAAYLVAWYFLPALFGFHLLPITTLNNPKFGAGLYQETPWFSLWWVNGIEVLSWLILVIPCMIAVWRFKR